MISKRKKDIIRKAVAKSALEKVESLAPGVNRSQFSFLPRDRSTLPPGGGPGEKAKKRIARY